jgi:hypothetical protein
LRMQMLWGATRWTSQLLQETNTEFYKCYKFTQTNSWFMGEAGLPWRRGILAWVSTCRRSLASLTFHMEWGNS